MHDALSTEECVQAPFPSSLMMRPIWESGAWVWHFRRNCSISPRQLLIAFFAFALFSALLAMFCWNEGVRLAAPFAALETAALGWALLVYARHAANYERIAISAQAVAIEWVHGGREGRAEFDPRRVRIQMQHRGLIRVSEGSKELLVGRYLRSDRRQSLARDLRRAILLT